MRIFIRIILFLITACLSQQLAGDYIITFFLYPYPHLIGPEKPISKEYAARKSRNLKKPGKIAKYTIRSLTKTKSVAGIFATYAGQLSVSNLNGQITFGRRQENPDLQLLISEKINPIFMTGQTIHHWELEGGFPATLYSVSQDREADTEIDYWKIAQIPLPENNRISINTIVLFTKPTYIYVPQGITFLEEKSADLILPDIYVKKNIDKLSSSLYVLNLKRFFSQTKLIYQIKENEYSILTQ